MVFENRILKMGVCVPDLTWLYVAQENTVAQRLLRCQPRHKLATPMDVALRTCCCSSAATLQMFPDCNSCCRAVTWPSPAPGKKLLLASEALLP